MDSASHNPDFRRALDRLLESLTAEGYMKVETFRVYLDVEAGVLAAENRRDPDD